MNVVTRQEMSEVGMLMQSGGSNPNYTGRPFAQLHCLHINCENRLRSLPLMRRRSSSERWKCGIVIGPPLSKPLRVRAHPFVGHWVRSVP